MASATWRTNADLAHLYFITTRAVQRAHVFRRDVIKRILVDSLNTGRILGQYELFVFVIMPNHIHVIIRCLKEYAPSDIVRELMKATSNLILRHYEAEDNQDALTFFASAVKAGQKQEHAVWEDEYQAKEIYSSDFLREKMEYIYNNPLQPHWRLAELPEEYVWSSTRFYRAGGRALIPLSDARELLI
jgi:putative transposase